MAIIDRRLGIDGRRGVLRTWPADAVNAVRQGGNFDCDLKEAHQVCPECKAEYLYMDSSNIWRSLDKREPYAIRKNWDNPPAWDFYLWCPVCDMRQQHSVSSHAAECCVCGESHEINNIAEDVIIFATTGKSALKEKKDE